ncbi:MAG: beta-N-acetylhexosaminidase [Terriglobia bacterium]
MEQAYYGRLFLFAFCLLCPRVGAETLGTEGIPLMPVPASVTMGTGVVPVDLQFTVALSGDGARSPRVHRAVQRAIERLARQTGVPVQFRVADHDNPTLQITVRRPEHAGPPRLGADERYLLDVRDGQVMLSADEPSGLYRGLETFLQMVQPNPAGSTPGFSVSCARIRDEPRFPWRGLSLDVSRHFIPVAGVERTLDGMAAVKLNVLHWHLSDDEGFRVESKTFPLLQVRGSDGLYYTQAQVREVVRYAADRGIRVVPEFDMPGHATSWFVGYPHLAAGKGPYQIVHSPDGPRALMDPTKESTYRFLDAFVGEMAGLFPDEYFHIGGDEVDAEKWNASPAVRAFMQEHGLTKGSALQAYFSARVTKIVMRHGKHVVGWAGPQYAGSPTTMVMQAWRDRQSLADAVKHGYRGVLSTGYYRDLAQPASVHYGLDPVQDETAGLTVEEQTRVLGGEAAMWEEIATAENLDSRLWPRLAAIAERLWSPASVTNVESMYSRLMVIDRWLEWLGLTQRSNLRLMRQRLAGTMSDDELERFASVLEPVKDFERQPHYGTLDPLNKLADAIPPESDTARTFREQADRYLSGPETSAEAASLHADLQAWLVNMPALRRVLSSTSLLVEHLETADALERLCQAGLEALDALSSGKRLSAAWKQKNLSIVQDGMKPHAETLIQIAPAIERLVRAVQTEQP